MATWTLSKIGAKFAGSCIVCHQSTSKVPLDVTPLYVREGAIVSDGEVMRGKDNYGVAHPECVGASWKRGISRNRIGGTPAGRIDTDAPKAAAYVVPAEQMAELERLCRELRDLAPLAPTGKTWFAPADLADALKIYRDQIGIADETEVRVAIQKLGEKVDARRAQIPGRKIEVS